MPDTLIMRLQRPKNYPAVIVFLLILDVALIWANVLVWSPDNSLNTPSPVQTEESSPPWQGNLFPTEEEYNVPQYPGPERPPDVEPTPGERPQPTSEEERTAPTTVQPDPSTGAPTPVPTPTPEPLPEPTEEPSPEPSPSDG